MEGWQRAFVLHGRPYSETSLLLDLFTEDEGHVRVLAKGARRAPLSAKRMFATVHAIAGALGWTR